MITELAKSLGRPLNCRHFTGPQFRHPVRLWEVQPLLDGLGRTEAELISLAATGSLGQVQADRRSVIIQLSPQQRPGLNLRFKGVYPEAAAGVVKRYDHGSGFVPVLIEPVDGVKLAARRERRATDFSPAGTMSAGRLRTEVETALALGKEISDELLGFGSYDDLTFNGEPVGFVYYAMGRMEDKRLLDIVHHSWRSDFLARFGDAARQAGGLLRSLHELGLVHRYPHLGNFTLDKQSGEVKLVDLDTTLRLASLPRETRLAWLYLDLSRTIIDFYAAELFGQPWSYHGKTMVDLLPHFFAGYFGRPVELPAGMPLDIEGVTGEEYDRKINLSPYWRPRYDAEMNLGQPVNLQHFAESTPEFQPFWQALTAVAGTIR